VCFREVNALTGDKHLIVMRLHAEYQDIWGKVTSDGATSGIFRPISVVALKGLLGMYFYSFLWINPKGKSTPEEIAEVFSDIVLRALAPIEPPFAESKVGASAKLTKRKSK